MSYRSGLRLSRQGKGIFIYALSQTRRPPWKENDNSSPDGFIPVSKAGSIPVSANDVSFFYQDGIHPASGGCLIHRDYVHIAIFFGDGRSIRTMLAHELTHNSVVHLRLPLWLNEGLAVLFQRTASEWHRDILEGDLRDRHLVFWNPDTIQRFWSGVSFGEPGESNELSYSLAEILVKLLLDQQGEFGAFVQQARWDDAGQTAALDCLGADLGLVAGTFLGEGDWRPQRKRMVECWEAAKKVKGTRTDGEAANCLRAGSA